MQALFKTLFGSTRTLMVGAAALAVAMVFLHSPLSAFAGVVMPVALLTGAAYLARH